MWNFPRTLVIILGTTLSLLVSCGAMPESGLQERRSQVLHDRYKVDWQANFDNKTIDFWIECRTAGFVGFGFSQSGSMAGADLVIGGVNNENGQIYFQDYHGTGNEFPTPDEKQNWQALTITQANGMTFLHLTRLLDTCDVNDLRIDDGTIKIMWSIGETDTPQYHGNEFRGTLAMNMLDPPIPPADLSSFETYNMTKKISMDGTIHTIYWCSMFKRTATKKTHIVAFQPKLGTPDSLKYTHHFNVYTCRAEPGMDADEVFGPFVDLPGQNCLTDQGGLAQVRYMCYQNLYAWSLGGRLLVFPEEIGMAWGETENEYYFMEVHLDNKEMAAIEVETGLTVFYTEELRPIEGGLLSIGHGTSPSLLIPPATTDWTLAGHCSSACTRRGIGPEGINMFNLNLHAHTSARKMKMRQFRDGKELPWPAKDDTYDFNYQENRPLANPIKILPGDHITMECTFDSTWKNPPGPVIGGASSYDEMCMVFVFYYPREPRMESCFSGYSTPKIMNRFGITNYTKPIGSPDPIIIEPVEWAGRRYTDILNEVTWDAVTKEELAKELRYGNHIERCYTGEDKDFPSLRQKSLIGDSMATPFLTTRGYEGWPNLNGQQKVEAEVSYPDFDFEYTEPDTCSLVNFTNFLYSFKNI